MGALKNTFNGKAESNHCGNTKHSLINLPEFWVTVLEWFEAGSVKESERGRVLHFDGHPVCLLKHPQISPLPSRSR